MQLTLIVLKNGMELISLSEKLDYEPAIHLQNPCTISGTTKLRLTRWPVYSSEEHVMLRSDDILTVCSPDKKLEVSYKKKFKVKASDFSEPFTKEAEPVILNEQASAASVPDFEDEYEPRYVEEY